MPNLSPARIALLRALDAGAELRTNVSFGYPDWAKRVPNTPSAPRQQVVRAAHDDGHLTLMRREPSGHCIAVGGTEYPVHNSVWTISALGRDALAQSTAGTAG
ncbi:hypothetical protein [Azospirillum sp.]|uniref:hypothetical protein n=1 Tax=Azospirillum sp. TaxID=34012 RepID=UPI002D5C3968|nr:hypothetical protein [Azospirillum sp.]HYD69280.1 hypothetical protein [Azospirillum sp.]